MAATSTYSTEACVSFLGLYCEARRSRRSSGTLAIPRWASRGLAKVRLEISALVRILNRDVLPTCGRPIMPVFIGSTQQSAVSTQFHAAASLRLYQGVKRDSGPSSSLMVETFSAPTTKYQLPS